MATNSTRRRAGGKPKRPKKPRKDFPLYAHAVGRWAKKVCGKTAYFTNWADDPKGQAALEQWLDQKDALLAGRTPQAKRGELAVRDLLNQFLSSKRESVEAGELSARSFSEYLGTCEMIAGTFGRNRAVADLAVEDFEKLRKAMAKRNGPVRLGNMVQRVRSIFNYALKSGWIDRLPTFGPAFKKPAPKVVRKARRANGPRKLEAEEIRRLIDAADVQLRAMILLGVNCGLGNTDCGRLETRHLDLKRGWLDYPRPKTEVDRQCPLWPETLNALRLAIADRPKPKGKARADLVFVTKYGNSWTRDGSLTAEGVKPPIDAVGAAFKKLLKALGLHRPRIGFYVLRHVFQTIGSRTRDEQAVSAIMGHEDKHTRRFYLEEFDGTRLRDVADYVRAWLFAEAPPRPKKNSEICDPTDPCDPPRISDPSDPGSHGPHGSQNTRKVLEGRPRLRIVG